jgi:hypothetical protein
MVTNFNKVLFTIVLSIFIGMGITQTAFADDSVKYMNESVSAVIPDYICIDPETSQSNHYKYFYQDNVLYVKNSDGHILMKECDASDPNAIFAYTDIDSKLVPLIQSNKQVYVKLYM